MLIEVTAAGLVVWKYVNPWESDTGVQSAKGRRRKGSSRNTLYRAYKYPEDYSIFEDID